MDIDSFRDIVVYNFGYSANDDVVNYIANELIEDYCNSTSTVKNDVSLTEANKIIDRQIENERNYEKQ